MKSEPIFLISLGRSGTHMLRGFLQDGFSATDFGEVFNVAGPAGKHDYFPFLIERIRRDPEEVIPRPETQEQRFDEFVGRLAEAAETPYFVVDVKYSQTHLLNGFWHQPGSAPDLIDLIKKRNYRVVHLVRKNVLATRASVLLARSNNIWVNYTSWDKPIVDEKVTIYVENIREKLTILLTCIRFFNGCLDGYPHVLGVFDEDLLRNGALCPVHAQHLAQFLGQPVPSMLRPTTRKIAPSLRYLIANYDDVMDELAGTPFAQLAQL